MSSYFRPADLNEAVAFLSGSPATIAAGCTDLFPATDRRDLSGPVLDVTGIAGLRGIERTATGWRIGATTTWADLIRADLPPAFDALRAAAREVGAVQIQNAGTLAGNLCTASPAADGVPCLLVLGAEVELTSVEGSRRVPLSGFIDGPRRTTRAPDELVTAIHIPEAAGRGKSRFLKLGARRYLVISIAMVAVRLVTEGDRIAEAAISVGACGPVATRLAALEQALTGLGPEGWAQAVTADRIDPALAPISDIRADAAYRHHAAAALIRRALTDLMPEAAV